MSDKLKRIKLKFPCLEGTIDCDECEYNEKNERRFNLRGWEEDLYNFKIKNFIKNHSDIVYFCNLQERINMGCHFLQGVNLDVRDLAIEGVEIIVDDKKHGFERRKEKPKFNEPWNPETGETYYFIGSYGNIQDRIKGCFDEFFYKWLIETGNCFKTYEQAEQRAKERKVYNLLKNFSDANGDGNILDYKIGLDSFNTFHVFAEIVNIDPIFNIKFSSREVAAEALRRYRKELEELVK